MNVRLVVNLVGAGGSGRGFQLGGGSGELQWSISCPRSDLIECWLCYKSLSCVSVLRPFLYSH